MFGFRNFPVCVFTFAIISPLSYSSKLPSSSTESGKYGFFCNYGGSQTMHFFPGLSPDLGTCSNHGGEQNIQCNDDSRTLQEHATNFTLWASLMVDATATYPTGVLYGNRYQLGNFDGCIAAASKSPVGSRYCLARLTYSDDRFQKKNEKFWKVNHLQFRPWIDWNDLDPNTDVRYMLQGLGQIPQEVSTRDVWMAVCVPKSCGPVQVQQAIKLEMVLWHPNLVSVVVPPDMCTAGEIPISVGLVIYSSIIASLLGVAVTASVWEWYGVVLTGRMGWIMYWSIPQRLKALMKPEKPIRGVHLQSFAGIRIITLVLLAVAHHCMHVPRAPLLNNFITRKTLMDPLAALATQAYNFVYTMLFLSGLFLALGSKKSFFRTVILRYLRLTPSYVAVVAFYAVAFPSMGSGPLWKSMINPEAQGCAKLWWTNLLYLNNFIRPNAKHGCILQSWSLAADMQLCILGTILLTAQKQWKKFSRCVLIIAILISMWMPFSATILGKREPIWKFTPRVLEDIWSWPLWDSYVSTEQWALPYFIGLGTGLFLEKSARQGLQINVHTKTVLISGATSMMLLLMISGVFWSYPNVQQHSLLAAIYATTIPTAWSICLALVSVAFALGPPTCLDHLLRSSFFVSTSRLGYSIYLIHFGAQIAHVAQMRAPRYVTVTNIIISSIQELILILPICLLLYLLIEAPIRELSKNLLKSKSKEPPVVFQLKPITNRDDQQTETTTNQEQPYNTRFNTAD